MEAFINANISRRNTDKKFERGINSQSLAAIFPFISDAVQDEKGVFLGFNTEPVFLDVFQRDRERINSNMVIIGKSGSGKSFSVKGLLSHLSADETKIFILDPEKEYDILAHNLGGKVVDVGSAKEGRINPFHIYKVLTEDGNTADPVVTFNTHLKMLESFFKIVFVGASSDVIELINNLAVETYERKGITEATDCTDFTPEQFPTFSDMYETLMLKDKDTMDALTLRDMRTAELYLQKFVKGRYSDIWNAPSTLEVDADLIDFNFQSLFANKNNTVANAQMRMTRSYVKSIGISKI